VGALCFWEGRDLYKTSTFLRLIGKIYSFELKFYLLPWLLIAVLPYGALANTYGEALSSYSDQKFAKCYRIAMEIADRYEGEDSIRQSKSLVLAAVSALELNKEQRAIRLYKAALERNPTVELPKVVKSKRVKTFFSGVKSGKITQNQGKGSIVEVISKSAFDHTDPETYYPFGINQFLQEKNISGLAFGSLQAFALYYSYKQYDAAKKTEEVLQK
jgi:hypothetical protein